MSFDIEQFKQVYIEESIENVEIMEKELLGLDINNVDLEQINTIFRAAHSIKGGAATFNFSDIAKFTHEVETLLDELRAGKKSLSDEIVNCLLRATDCIKMMLDVYVNGDVKDEQQITTVLNEVKVFLETAEESSDTSASSEDVDTEQSIEKIERWLIKFVPYENLLFSGNEPLRLFRELEQLGELSVLTHYENLPSFNELDSEKCYVSWDLIIEPDEGVEETDIAQVFDWVEGDCDLIITAEKGDAVFASEISDIQQEAVTNESNIPPIASETPNEIDSKSPSQDTKNKPAPKAAKAKSSTGMSIRVDIDKVDTLINLVGELVITQSMLSELGSDFNMSKIERLQSGLGQLLQNTKELQESVMRIRMLPISNAFNRFPRMVRDLALQLEKKIELKVSGEQTELDKTVMEQITDPLVHLVRNAIDHGIESPEQRLQFGKNETGTIKLNAYHEGGNIVIEIIDDGAGLDKDAILNKARQKGLINDIVELHDSEIYNLIFAPGFSTAAVITDVSGRGVGMDVVKKNITRLGGEIEIESEKGSGTTIRVRLPLTLAIVDGQLIKVADQTYVIPLISIVESLQIKSELVRNVSGAIELYKLRDENVPIVRIYREFSLDCEKESLSNSMLVVVEGGGTKIGLLVDELMAQQQVVIKSLETNYCKVEGISGATILGDGKVALIIDVADLIRKSMRQRAKLSEGQAA